MYLNAVFIPCVNGAEDIPFLARRFLQEAALRNGLTEEPRLSEEILSRLCLYEWPGNVRELRNAMERAAVLAAGREVKTGDLPGGAVRGTGRRRRQPAFSDVARGGGSPYPPGPGYGGQYGTGRRNAGYQQCDVVAQAQGNGGEKEGGAWG